MKFFKRFSAFLVSLSIVLSLVLCCFADGFSSYDESSHRYIYYPTFGSYAASFYSFSGSLSSSSGILRDFFDQSPSTLNTGISLSNSDQPWVGGAFGTLSHTPNNHISLDRSVFMLHKDLQYSFKLSFYVNSSDYYMMDLFTNYYDPSDPSLNGVKIYLNYAYVPGSTINTNYKPLSSGNVEAPGYGLPVTMVSVSCDVQNYSDVVSSDPSLSFGDLDFPDGVVITYYVSFVPTDDFYFKNIVAIWRSGDVSAPDSGDHSVGIALNSFSYYGKAYFPPLNNVTSDYTEFKDIITDLEHKLFAFDFGSLTSFFSSIAWAFYPLKYVAEELIFKIPHLRGLILFSIILGFFAFFIGIAGVVVSSISSYKRRKKGD